MSNRSSNRGGNNSRGFGRRPNSRVTRNTRGQGVTAVNNSGLTQQDLASIKKTVSTDTVNKLVNLAVSFATFRKKVPDVGSLYINSQDTNEIIDKLTNIMDNIIKHDKVLSSSEPVKILRDSIVNLMTTDVALIMKIYEMESKISSLMAYLPELQKRKFMNDTGSMQGTSSSGQVPSMGMSTGMGMGQSQMPSRYSEMSRRPQFGMGSGPSYQNMVRQQMSRNAATRGSNMYQRSLRNKAMANAKTGANAKTRANTKTRANANVGVRKNANPRANANSKAKAIPN